MGTTLNEFVDGNLRSFVLVFRLDLPLVWTLRTSTGVQVPEYAHDPEPCLVAIREKGR